MFRKGSTSAGNDYALDPGVSSRIPLQVGLKTLSSNINHVPIISQEEVEADEEQPLFRKRTGRRLNPAVTGSSNTEFQESYGQGISQDDVKQYEEQPLTRLNRHLNPNLEEPELHEEPIMTRSIAPMPSGSNGDVAHQDEVKSIKREIMCMKASQKLMLLNKHVYTMMGVKILLHDCQRSYTLLKLS